MFNQSPLLQTKFYFGYSQFFVLDSKEDDYVFHWTDETFAQGFARRSTAIGFRTLLEDGFVHLSIYLGGYSALTEYDRVIGVPIAVPSGRVAIKTCEGWEPIEAQLNPGNYRVFCAQKLFREPSPIYGETEEQLVDLFLEELQQTSNTSQIIVADKSLSPPAVLVEWCDSF